MNQPRTFIFIGRSGCGKGTQAELLKEYLETHDPDGKIAHIETGALYRDFVQGTSETALRARAILEEGKLEPDFLTVTLWGSAFVAHITPDIHLLLDGMPRRASEPPMLDSAFAFYGRDSVDVINIEVSPEWSRARLAGRGRADDKEASDVENRLSWFETDTVPALEWFRKNKRYHVHDVNGEQTIQEVHQEIVKNLFV